MSSQPSQPQAHLPRFSNPKDIDDFVEKLEAFERGELGPDQFRAFRLTRGVYGQRQDDEQMIRVKIPAGLIGKEQLEALADVGDRYARGLGHLTTRQNVQFHFVKMKDAEAALRRLDEAGLTTREACGNSVRTVTACTPLVTRLTGTVAVKTLADPKAVARAVPSQNAVMPGCSKAV